MAYMVNNKISNKKKSKNDIMQYAISHKLSLSGFTLVELLISVAIIGILSSFVIVNLGGFRERTRDTQRKKDLYQIQTALEWYRTDAGNYPATAAFPNCGANLVGGTTVYMQRTPCDPLGSPAWGARYFYTSTGNAYVLYACLENANDAERDTARQANCSAARASFTVRSL